MSKQDPKLKNEKLKALEPVDFEMLTEDVDNPDQGVIRHPSHVQVPASSIPRTAGGRSKKTKKN